MPPGHAATNRGRVVQLHDVQLYYEDYGAGRPLVLLHGFGGCGQNWRPFTDQLSQRYRLIVVDLRGHGGSTNPDNEFTHRQAAEDVSLLLDQIGVSRFSAMGMSSGGMVLLHLATRQPERIEAMVLISATSHFPDQARAIMRAASFQRMPPSMQAMYRDCARRGDEQIHRLIAHFNALGDNRDDMQFTPDELSAVTARTLVIHGDRDRFFPVEIPVGLYRSMPNAALWVIPGGDHVPIYDSTVPFVSTALRFLDGADNRSPEG